LPPVRRASAVPSSALPQARQACPRPPCSLSRGPPTSSPPPSSPSPEPRRASQLRLTRLCSQRHSLLISSPVRALKNPSPCGRGRIRGRKCLIHSVSKHVRVLATGRCNNLVQVVTTRSVPRIHINRVQLLGVVTLRQVASVTYRRDLAVTIAVVKVPVTTGLFAGQIHGIARGKNHAERASFRACGNPCISDPAPVAIRINRVPPERLNELVNI